MARGIQQGSRSQVANAPTPTTAVTLTDRLGAIQANLAYSSNSLYSVESRLGLYPTGSTQAVGEKDTSILTLIEAIEAQSGDLLARLQLLLERV